MRGTPLKPSRGRRTGAGVSCASGKKGEVEFLPFQRRFLARSLSPDLAISCLSTPRGSGKSLLASRLLNEALPGGKLFVPAAESVLLAGSMNQARAVFRFLRAMYPCPKHLDKKCPHCGLRWLDSMQRIGVTHWSSDTKITVRGKSGKLALGLVNCPIIVGDEPGSWDVTGGQEMVDALITSAGKTRQLLCLIGTLAPGGEGGWWRDLIAAGCQPGVYVQTLTGNPDKWDQWREVLRVNPVAKVNTILRSALRRELDEAKRDTRAKARFKSFRINIPSADDVSVLLTVDEFTRVVQREIPPRVGRPAVGVDCGSGRAWSAAVAVWANGRTEAIALSPGTPSLTAQETRDRVPRGTYHAPGGRPSVDALTATCESRACHGAGRQAMLPLRGRGRSPAIGSDSTELQDAVGGRCRVEPRGQRWSEASPRTSEPYGGWRSTDPLSDGGASSRHLIAGLVSGRASKVESLMIKARLRLLIKSTFHEQRSR